MSLKKEQSWGFEKITRISQWGKISHCDMWKCTTSGCSWDLLSNREWCKRIIAFDSHSRIGYIVCPNCQACFWLHLSDSVIVLAKQICPNWPK